MIILVPVVPVMLQFYVHPTAVQSLVRQLGCGSGVRWSDNPPSVFSTWPEDEIDSKGRNGEIYSVFESRGACAKVQIKESIVTKDEYEAWQSRVHWIISSVVGGYLWDTRHFFYQSVYKHHTYPLREKAWRNGWCMTLD